MQQIKLVSSLVTYIRLCLVLFYSKCSEFYIANVLPLQWAQLTKTLHTTLLGREFVCVVLGCMIYVHMFCFILVS